MIDVKWYNIFVVSGTRLMKSTVVKRNIFNSNLMSCYPKIITSFKALVYMSDIIECFYTSNSNIVYLLPVRYFYVFW